MLDAISTYKILHIKECSKLHLSQVMWSSTYVGELALDCGDTGSIGDISRADFVATGRICVAGIAACSNDRTSSALAQAQTNQSALLNCLHTISCSQEIKKVNKSATNSIN